MAYNVYFVNTANHDTNNITYCHTQVNARLIKTFNNISIVIYLIFLIILTIIIKLK